MGKLSDYRRKDSAINGEWVTLPKGVEVELREWGCPQFYEAMGVRPDEESSKEIKEAALDRAISRWSIKTIKDGDDLITDPDQIHQIITDPRMWEFRIDVINASVETDRWLESEETVKNLQTSLSQRSGGGEDSQEKKKAIPM